MKVLITKTDSPLGSVVQEELRHQHELRLGSGRHHKGVDDETVDLLDPASVEQAVVDRDAIVYLLPALTKPLPQTPEEDHEELNFATRGTYNLYMAAVKADVKKIVHVSSLSVMGLWPREYIVSETWRPRPAAEARSLGFHLSEEISREVARESNMTVVCLRMTTLVREEEVVGEPFDPTWLEVRDAATACRMALELEPRWTRWMRAHVGPTHPYAVWPSMHSWSHYGEIRWQPQHDFKAWWPSASPGSDTAIEQGGAS